MINNKLIIAAAGSGKTTYLIKEAMKYRDEKVLITTYTEANEAEIRSKITKKHKCVPSHITIQTWFSFLIQHGVRPYQSSFNSCLFDRDIKGMILNEGKYGIKFFKNVNGKKIPVPYKEETEFEKHYFSDSYKIYSDKLSNFIIKANIASHGELINRLTRIYKHIYIDEVQDLAGYDLDIIKLLFKSNSNILLVGDPRQVTYLTHHESKYAKYQDGRIKDFIHTECKKPIHVKVDETTLNKSHRNNLDICNFSKKVYPEYSNYSVFPCDCVTCRNYVKDFEGIYLVKPNDANNYLAQFHPMQLRWNNKAEINLEYGYCNFGESKGKAFDRVIIYPTVEMKKWIFDNDIQLKNETKAKLYVAITRAKYSVAIIADYPDDLISSDCIQLYRPS